ncbi:MAG TPA: biliverdin-producing heme oxygenase [Novosphingobium sp.]|nr:biliverdin-producing heme oxygenase [Novosphingobium sp.]
MNNDNSMLASPPTASPPSLLERLREATGPSHQRLDASFGSLALTDRADYARFLAAHFIGLASLMPLVQDFAERELAFTAPDMLSMLRQDLAELGPKAEDLPRMKAPPDLAPLGVTYVVAGSRLGLAMIRKQDYWGRGQGLASRYMEDEQGLALWRVLAVWLRTRAAPAADAARHCQSAITAFDLFGRAFDASERLAA